MDQEHSFDDAIEQMLAAEPKFIEDPDEELSETPEDLPDPPLEETGEEPQAEASPEEPAADPADPASDPAPEDLSVEITLGDETRKVPLSELKDLYTKSGEIETRVQAITSQNRAVETQGLMIAKIYQDRLTTAQEQASRFANIDLFQAYRELDPQSFQNLKTQKEAAEAELATVTSEAQNFMQNALETKRAFLRDQAMQSLQVIRKEIPDWNDDVYGKVRTYAVSQGMHVDDVNETVDAASIIMMHKAMQFDDARSKSGAVTEKVLNRWRSFVPSHQ